MANKPKIKLKGDANDMADEDGAEVTEEVQVQEIPAQATGTEPPLEDKEVVIVEEPLVNPTQKEEVKEEVTIKEEEVGIDMDAVEGENIQEKKVKICLLRDHSCFIGGTRWNFEAGKQYNVPANVKSILLRENLLKPF